MVKLRSDQRHPCFTTSDPDPTTSFTVFKPGDRIAQACIVDVPQVKFMEVDELGATVRGANGFGSTGQGPHGQEAPR